MKPTLVLVGRPNVGKSTLFNRLTKSRDAIVADLPGLTHPDGRSAFALWFTGGIFVNAEGRRFTNESAAYDRLGRAVLELQLDEQGKRLANQALTGGIELGEDDEATIRLAEPLASVTSPATSHDVAGSSTSEKVPSKGFEPSTYRLGGGRSSPELRGRTSLV